MREGLISVTLDRPWLIARLAQPMRVLSWAPFGGGLRVTDLVLWREVRDADLSEGFDAEGWLAAQMPDPGAVGMLTSRDVGSFRRAAAQVQGIRAEAVVTLGLSNAEAVGTRRAAPARGLGTINILAATDAPLTEAAQLEALSIAVQARTAAVMDLDWPVETGRSTGTGTDCLALACPAGPGRYAGLHTELGEALGAAVRAATRAAGEDWCRGRARPG